MATEIATPVRFSNPSVNTSTTAQQFPWEKGVPVNKFWDSIDWVSSVHFLGNFTADELSRLPIDINSTADTGNKLKILLELLEAKVADENKAAAPKLFAETRPQAWRRLVFAQYVLQSKLGLTTESGRTIRALVDNFGDNADDVLRHSLADQLVEEGDFVQAEKILGPIVTKLDEKMTRASPQAIGARRSLLKAIWKQEAERRADGEAVLDEIRKSITEMKGTQFEVYVKDEEEELEKVLASLAE